MAKLAIDGGPSVCGGKKWPRTLIGPEERLAALRAIDHAIEAAQAFNRYGGEETDAYEREFAEFVGSQAALAVSSGTAAIHTALGALHLEPGSEVICSPITDPGAIGPVLFQLCVPVFADTAPDAFNSCAAGVERALSDKTAAIVIGHIAGEPADLAPILEIARARRIPLIEDCSQAHAAEYQGRQVGTWGALGVFSTMSGKHHTSGGQGGVIVTDDEALRLEAFRFHDRGKPFGAEEKTNLFLGHNFRFTEIQAAIGRAQLRKLPRIVAQRRKLVERLRANIGDLKSLRLPEIARGNESSWWFLRVRFDGARVKAEKAQFAAALAAEGVGAAATYTSLIYDQKWFRERRTFGQSQIPWSLPQYGRDISYERCCPNAERALADHLLIHFHEGCTEETMDLYAEALRKVEQAYLR